MDQARHEMTLVSKHASGAEEWHCPTCGRRFLMTWPPPAYKKIVLEAGDEYAQHTGSKGDVRLSTSIEGGMVTPSEDAPTLPPSDLSDDWRRWLSDAGFSEWWGDND